MKARPQRDGRVQPHPHAASHRYDRFTYVVPVQEEGAVIAQKRIVGEVRERDRNRYCGRYG